MNTNRRKLCLMLLIVNSLILGCSSNSNTDIIVQPAKSANVEIAPTKAIPNIFSIQVNESVISLKSWEHEMNNKELLGEPFSSEIKELGSGADTLSGSFTKVLTYDGLLLELFSPKQNGKDYWISTIDITKPGYITSNGIEVGQSLQELLSAYPDLHTVESETELNSDLYQIINELESNYLEIEVKEGFVHRIKMYHLIP